MLSRAAAVKAPRTHNRRRVTGSSGRRREGRESERQRPNMSRHHFYSAVLLLLVAMMCCGSGVVANVDVEPSTASKFEWEDISDGVTVESLRVPGLFSVGHDVFAVAEAQCKKEGEGNAFTGIASQLLTKEATKEPEELLKEAGKKSLFMEKGDSHEKKRVDVSRPTTVVKENDIYMLVGNYSRTAATDDQDSVAEDWGLLLVKGEVRGNEASSKGVLWKEANGVTRAPFAKELVELKWLIGGGGSGVYTGGDTLLFPVEAAKKENDGRTVSLILYSLKDTNNWKLSKEIPADGCSNPSVVEWKYTKLIVMTACDGGRRRVYESGDKGDSWTEALGTLSRVWGNPKAQMKCVASGFITATIEDMDLMLVTLPVYSKPPKGREDNGKGRLYLWLTDNTHILDIGPVSEEEEDAAASSLMYRGTGSGDDKKEELIALYEKKKGGEKTSFSMVSVRLAEQLKRVKEVLTTWRDVDKSVSNMCVSLRANQGPLTGYACSATATITTGLVGFLSGNFSENTWRDEYLGVHATVKKVTEGVAEAVRVAAGPSDGVTFQGAWAEWPVGAQGENQLYHFANYNFTLVATVSIHNVPTGVNPIPLMGVRAGKEKLMELSYDSGKKWRVLCSDGKTKRLQSTWEKETQYQVAIVLQNGTQGIVYVDGKRVCGDAQRKSNKKESKVISHFYLGGDGDSADNTRGGEVVRVTVKNVLLYNRPWTLPGEEADVEENIPPALQATALPSQDTLSPLEATALPPGGLQPSEGTSPSAAGDQKTVPPAGQSVEAPVVQATSQQAPQENKTEEKNTTVGESATTQEVPANTSKGSVERAAASNSHAVGGATGDGSTVCESGLLPSLLLLLLGLWGFAAL
ncbi:trans-sialidase, putative [Trypanosoma cruzi marinkellei]|uniref:Trans-sialidase, putative n=1 Tax=Trypanosoma cruzi marinkellei TaxID=85056 RepID=K2M036_TRYCR|nr:trans-sialidase, putative [Trypanosoma cruzi marinkellei]